MLQLGKASFFMKYYHIYDNGNFMTEFLVNLCTDKILLLQITQITLYLCDIFPLNN